MKRHGYLYGKVCEMENLHLAHKNASRGKMHYTEVKMVDSDPDYYLNLIRKMLVNKTFKNSEYTEYLKTDGPKERLIHKLPYYPDRIIHHAIMQILEPIWFGSLVRDTYSAIKGRGIHDGVKRIQKALKDVGNTRYCLKMDVRKFYPSIDNDILKTIIRRKIKDPDLVWLLDEIINSAQGVPIGNYLSQYFGNIYLSGLDHWMKESLSVQYYFRYCDDFVILSASKIELHALRKSVKTYLNRLNLNMKNNWQVFPVDSRGIDFLGYRFYHGYTLLRKSIKQNFIVKIKTICKTWHKLSHSQIINVVMSYCGWLKYANTRNLRNKYLDNKLFWIMKHISKKQNMKNPLQGLL
ncbi:MAG: RNA-directed DNA polymerase [Candidatus Marinimicrobia bacterium]|nr:RNA-directed DNA polymerase [Candidatus Neomarinimicrobiota bacterium]